MRYLDTSVITFSTASPPLSVYSTPRWKCPLVVSSVCICPSGFCPLRYTSTNARTIFSVSCCVSVVNERRYAFTPSFSAFSFLSAKKLATYCRLYYNRTHSYIHRGILSDICLSKHIVHRHDYSDPSFFAHTARKPSSVYNRIQSVHCFYCFCVPVLLHSVPAGTVSPRIPFFIHERFCPVVHCINIRIQNDPGGKSHRI